MVLVDRPPCLLFEDDDLLVVNKPPGLNTHAPSPHAGEGLYDWLRDREPRWADLAILQRLDKETSGVLLFARSRRANQSLARQFEERTVEKTYLLLTDRPVPPGPHRLTSGLVRAGDRYLSRPPHAGAVLAETTFRALGPAAGGTLVEAVPATGRTHQVRVHAAALGLPILGDRLYGGAPHARLCLHAARLVIAHPATGMRQAFAAPAEFGADPRAGLRAALIDPASTTVFRIQHGAADGQPGWHVDRLGEFLLSQSDAALTAAQRAQLARWQAAWGCRGAYHRRLLDQPGALTAADAAPQRVDGESAEGRFTARESGIGFTFDFAAGYSAGLFPDQRDNRRRILTNHVAAGFTLHPAGARGATVLNTFAYTGGFSVAAALAGSTTTSIDLSRRALDWARDNFRLNALDPAAHRFLAGDVFDWLRRLARKSAPFDLVILDPPTFSRTKGHGVFRAEKDYARLVRAALPLLRDGGTLLACANTARLPATAFLDQVHTAVRQAGCQIAQEHYAPQPPDFPVAPDEPAHLKSVWMRITGRASTVR